MKITGHQTPHVFQHYDIGNVDVLRDPRARAYAKSLPTESNVVPLEQTVGE